MPQRRRRDRVDIFAHGVEISAAQAVVAAKFDNGDRGPMLREQRRESRASASGRIAADAGIDDAMRKMLGGEPILQQRRPAGTGGQPVPRGDAVADDQDHRRRGLRERDGTKERRSGPRQSAPYTTERR